MKKETECKKVYKSIEGNLKKLGISTNDSAVIMNCIDFIACNKVSHVKEESLKSNSKMSGKARIVEVMSQDLNRMFSRQDLSDATGISPGMTNVYLKQLRKSGKVRVVGYQATSNKGLVALLYQVSSSPLETLKIVPENEGYISISNFINNNKSIKWSVSQLLKAVKETGISEYAVLKGTHIVKGYKEKELMGIVSGILVNNTEDVVRPKRVYTKRRNWITSLFSKKKNNVTRDMINY